MLPGGGNGSMSSGGSMSSRAGNGSRHAGKFRINVGVKGGSVEHLLRAAMARGNQRST